MSEKAKAAEETPLTLPDRIGWQCRIFVLYGDSSIAFRIFHYFFVIIAYLTLTHITHIATYYPNRLETYEMYIPVRRIEIEGNPSWRRPVKDALEGWPFCRWKQPLRKSNRT